MVVRPSEGDSTSQAIQNHMGDIEMQGLSTTGGAAPPVPAGPFVGSMRQNERMSGPVVPAVFHLRRARDLIDRHFAEPLDLDAMARAAGFSRYHFARAFRVAYGETPGAYLTRRRVERAQDLLRSANLTVTEICHLVGFSSLGSFSATFSQLVGVPPTEYRRVHVADSGPPPIPGCFLMAWSRPLPGSASEPSQIYEHDELLVLEDLVVEEAPAAGEQEDVIPGGQGPPRPLPMRSGPTARRCLPAPAARRSPPRALATWAGPRPG
jgi:AraC-like DNA-binding protein